MSPSRYSSCAFIMDDKVKKQTLKKASPKDPKMSDVTTCSFISAKAQASHSSVIGPLPSSMMKGHMLSPSCRIPCSRRGQYIFVDDVPNAPVLQRL